MHHIKVIPIPKISVKTFGMDFSKAVSWDLTIFWNVVGNAVTWDLLLKQLFNLPNATSKAMRCSVFNVADSGFGKLWHNVLHSKTSIEKTYTTKTAISWDLLNYET